MTHGLEGSRIEPHSRVDDVTVQPRQFAAVDEYIVSSEAARPPVYNAMLRQFNKPSVMPRWRVPEGEIQRTMMLTAPLPITEPLYAFLVAVNNVTSSTPDPHGPMEEVD